MYLKRQQERGEISLDFHVVEDYISLDQKKHTTCFLAIPSHVGHWVPSPGKDFFLLKEAQKPQNHET